METSQTFRGFLSNWGWPFRRYGGYYFSQSKVPISGILSYGMIPFEDTRKTFSKHPDEGWIF
jgi:hypothetical protein